MSYAIILTAAEESGTFLSEDEQTRARGVETFNRIESRTRQLLGDDAGTWRPTEPGAASFGEVTDRSTGLQVVLTGEGAQVRFPIDGYADATTLHERARQLIRIVQEETGWDAYDAQTERDFDGRFHVVDRPVVAPTAGMTTAGPTGAESEPARALLKSLKRRAITSYILAAVILGAAVWDLTVGSVGTFTWVLLVIGAINLISAVVVTVRTKGLTDVSAFR